MSQSPLISQYEVQSKCHSRSWHWHRSTSQAAARARAEAARAKAQYAKRQIDKLNALKQEREAEATHAAAQVLDAAVEQEHPDAVNLTYTGIPVQTPQSIRRAQEFVDACKYDVKEEGLHEAAI